MSKNLYVNSLEFGEYINPNHDMSIIDIHKIDFKEFITGMMNKRLIKEVDERYAQNDPYLLPINIIIPLISANGDTMYFVDEYFSSGDNKVSFLGGELSTSLLRDNIRNTSVEEFTTFCNNFMLYMIEKRFSRSVDIEYTLSFVNNVNDCLYRYIDINDSNISIEFYQYVLGTGLFFYTRPVIVNCSNDKLTELTYLLWRSFKLRKDRDRWDIDNARKELQPSDVEQDCRLNDFDIISNLFELVKLLGIQNSF